MDVNKIAKIGWTQRWSGSYTYISCSFWGPQYFYSQKRILGVNFKHTLFVHKKGTVDFYVATGELHELGKTLAKRAVKSITKIKKYVRLIKQNADRLDKAMAKLSKKIPSWREFQSFAQPFDNHIAYHAFIKETVDYLPPDKLKTLLPYFEDGRKYSEHIYSRSESFFRKLAELIAKKESVGHKALTCLNQTELKKYLKNRKLPNLKILKARYRGSILYFDRTKLLTENSIKAISALEKAIVKENLKHNKTLRGIAAYPGIVKGIAKVIPDPHHYKNFNQGDILVTGMTRPEFLPLINKCSAIITDSGGILSHAAITAREMKKPCIIGTKIATKILKDGDIIDVDANKGIVKIIKK